MPVPSQRICVDWSMINIKIEEPYSLTRILAIESLCWRRSWGGQERSMNRKNISYHKEGGWLGYTATYTIHFASILPILAYKHNIQLIPKYLHICSVWTSYISSSPNLKWYYVNMSLQLPPANITTMWYGGTGTYLWRYCRCHHNKIFYF